MKKNKDLINKITFHFQDDDGKAVDFRGETVTFTIFFKSKVYNVLTSKQIH